MININASAYALRLVLLQQQDDINLNEWAAIGYRSETLNQTKQNYSAVEWDCYVVVGAIHSLRPYIEGTSSEVRMCHIALK